MGGTCTESVRWLGKDLWVQEGNLRPHLGPGSGESPRDPVAGAGVDVPGQEEHPGADSDSQDWFSITHHVSSSPIVLFPLQCPYKVLP